MLCNQPRSEENELLLDVTGDLLGFNSDDIESHGLGDGSALSDSHNISFLKTESGGMVDTDGFMSLLESIVFLYVMQVISSNDKSSSHLCGDNNSSI